MHLHRSAKQNRPPRFACSSSRLRHWLHSSEAPKYGGELLSLYQQLCFSVYAAYTRGRASRNFSDWTMTNMLLTYENSTSITTSLIAREAVEKSFMNGPW